MRKAMNRGAAHGGTAFTVPLSEEYLRRAIPQWQPRQH